MSTKYPIESDDFRLDEIVKNANLDEELEFAGRGARRSASEGEQAPARRGWRVNYWLLTGTLVALMIIGPSLYVWRNYQVQRNANVLVTRAETLEREGDWRAAADFYHRYLQLVPGDNKVLLARARAFDETAVSPDRANRAIGLMLQAVDVDPDDLTLRLRLLDRLYEQRRWEAAREQAQKILQLAPENLEAARINALAFRNQLGPRHAVAITDVVQAHIAALEKHPGDPTVSVSLANVYRDNLTSFHDLSPEEVAEAADEVIDRMVAESPDDSESYLGRYRYRRVYDLEGARDDLERILQREPDSPEILLAAAAEFVDSDLDRSLDLAERLLEVAPDDPRSQQILAQVQVRLGKIDEAITTLNDAIIRAGGESYPLQRMLLGVALDTRRLELADDTWKALNAWRQRVSPYLTTVDRRRLEEDLQVLKARHQILSGRSDVAIDTLRPLTVTFTEGSDADENLRQREQRWRLMAEAYGQQQKWDLAAQAMAEAARLRPTGRESLLAEAGFVRRAGNLERAIQLVEEATAKTNSPPTVWLVLAELLIESEFQRAEAGTSRDWRRVRTALDRAKLSLDGTPEYVTLRARWALADGRAEDALAELQRLLPVANVPLESADSLALLFAAAGDRESAEELVDRLLAEPQFVEQAEVTRVELLARSRDYEGARERLEELASTGRETERQDLLPRLIALELEGGYIQEARQRLARFRDQGPATLPLLEIGASIALQGKHWEELEKYVQALELMEGPDGTVWRFYEALANLEDRSEKQKLDLVEAGKLLKKLEELRPQWPSNLMVKGRLAERQGKPDQAVAHYQEAVRQGVRSALLVDWLVSGLYRQNRFEEALTYLRQLGPMAGVSTQLSGLALPAYIREGRTEDALRVARMSAELHAGDPIPQMLYGQALVSAGELEQAEAQFRTATELAPNEVRAWGGLIWFYATTQQVEQVRATIDVVNELAVIAPAERQLLSARAFAIIGDRDAATLRFQEALDDRPGDANLLAEVAQFYLQFNLDRALELYRRALEISPNSTGVRRAIALIVSMRGTDEGLTEALHLLRSREASDSSPLDDRLEAVILMRGNETQRIEAVERLASYIAAQDDVALIDRLLLARAFELADRPDDAQGEYENLLSETANAEAYAIYVAFLLRQQRFESADDWLKKLEEEDSAWASSFALRAEWLSGMERHEEIDAIAERHFEKWLDAEGPERQAAVRQAITILRMYDRLEVVERLLRSYAKVDTDGGEMLVSFLVEQQRMGEALQLGLELAAQYGDERPPLALLQVMTLMAAKKAPSGLLHQDAEAQFERARKIHGENVQFLFDLGTLRIMQGRDDDAIELYEQTLAISPDYLPALNNLAIVLVGIPERRDEAVSMIERLISLVPDSVEVKDSYAMVLIGCGRFAEAKEIMTALVEANPGNAQNLLHLAVAHDGLGNHVEAREAFHAALSQQLEDELLTPVEDDYVNRLLDRYGSNGVPEAE